MDPWKALLWYQRQVKEEAERLGRGLTRDEKDVFYEEACVHACERYFDDE